MIIKTGYNVVDGICGDLSFEEGGSPVVSNRIIAGRDPLMVDSFCAELIGYKPDEIEHLAIGKEIGVGKYFTNETKLVELNSNEKPSYEIKSDRVSDRYKNHIVEDAACSACYSSLIFALHRLKGRGRLDSKIYIGQGFVGKSGTGVGIGSCTSGFSKNILGCPPKATEIINALK